MSQEDPLNDLSNSKKAGDTLIATGLEGEITRAIAKLSPGSIVSLVKMGITKHVAFRTHVDAVILSIAKADEKFRNELFKIAEKDTLPQSID